MKTLFPSKKEKKTYNKKIKHVNRTHTLMERQWCLEDRPPPCQTPPLPPKHPNPTTLVNVLPLFFKRGLKTHKWKTEWTTVLLYVHFILHINVCMLYLWLSSNHLRPSSTAVNIAMAAILSHMWPSKYWQIYFIFPWNFPFWALF